MTPVADVTSFTLRDIAGEYLIQDTPYAVVAPRNLDMLALIIQYARIEGLRVLPLGTGSSFDHDFKLSNSNMIAILTGGLTGIQKLAFSGFRVLSGTPLMRLYRTNPSHERKTVGSLIAGSSGMNDNVIKALLPRLNCVETMNGQGKLQRFAGASMASAEDPGLAHSWFGSQGHFGMITAIELRGPLPLEIVSENSPFGTALSPNELAVKRLELARLFDPDSLFAW